MMITIYALCDPVTGKCMYVGATKNLKTRLAGHKYGEVLSTRDWISQLGCPPKCRIIDEVDYTVAGEDEVFYILYLNPPLNDNAVGYHYTPELCAKISTILSDGRNEPQLLHLKRCT